MGALQDAMTGQADYVFDPSIPFPYVHAGKERMLAVAGAKRSSFLPDVPTLSGLGFKDAELDIWFGFWAKNGTPADITSSMGCAIAKALTFATTKTRSETLETQTVGMDILNSVGS